MTIFSDIESIEPAGDQTTVFEDTGQFAVDETYWGYIVRSTEPASIFITVMQLFAWVTGLAFCFATVALWLTTAPSLHGAMIGMKIGASVMTSAVAAFCLWFASRGTDSEIQIDTKLGEIREVVRNRAGRPTMIGRYGFDTIGSVAIEYGVARGQRGISEGELVLRYRNSGHKLHVARGALARLGGLRDRVGRDLMITGRIAQPQQEPAGA